ncbi:MAG: HAD family hydrolase [Ectothiorhodospiraceae bacterium]|nr:HAD family hydrolase [Chromatiales bacterium]MCP5155460.1 HAD family hydrolase [Ectothiorhodospiraceae bacterium]
MRIRGILFDKDGTLVDFDRTWGPAYATAAVEIARLAGEVERADRLLEVGGRDRATGRYPARSVLACGTTREIAVLWAGELDIDDVDHVAARLEAVFARTVVDGAAPVADLGELTARLCARGLCLGVATMDSEAIAHATLARFRIADRMSFVCGYDSGHGEKPGPGMVNAFCRHTGLAPSAVAVVGDTPHDLAMGRAAGAGLVVGVLTGTGTRETLEPLADVVLADATGLLDLLDRG